MSVSRYIVCKTCKQRLHVGQANCLYSGEENTMLALRDFLLIYHAGDAHELHSLDEHYEPIWEYEEVE